MVGEYGEWVLLLLAMDTDSDEWIRKLRKNARKEEMGRYMVNN